MVHSSLLNLTFSLLSTTSTNKKIVVYNAAKPMCSVNDFADLLLTERHHRHLRMSDVQSQSSLRLHTPLSYANAIKQCVSQAVQSWSNSIVASERLYRPDLAVSDASAPRSTTTSSNCNRLLRDHLYWLPVPQRVQFKLCLLTYKDGLAPSYIADLSTSHIRRQQTDSNQPLVATF